MKTFEDWLKDYMAFRETLKPVLGKRVPNDSGNLQMEAQDLEPLYYEAEEHRALGATYYYRAKHETIQKLHAEGYAVSALSEMAKAASYKQLWGMESAEGVCNAIRDRKIKVAQFMKLQANP